MVRKHGRKLGLAWLLASVGCVTALPLQTASTVPQGAVRVGGELAVTPWCTLSLDPFRGCVLGVNGFPLPEARLDARVGLGEAMDLGASLRATGVIMRGAEVGLSVDGRRELWSRFIAPEQRQIITLGPALGVDGLLPVMNSGTAGGISTKLTLPVYLGHQTEGFEWVLSPRMAAKLSFPAAAGRPTFLSGEFGLALAVVSRGSTHWGLQLSYHAPLDFPTSGLIVLAAGFQVDLGLPAPAPVPAPTPVPAPAPTPL